MPSSAQDERAEYALRRELHLCPRCKAEVEGVRVFCAQCRVYHRQQQTIYRIRKRRR